MSNPLARRDLLIAAAGAAAGPAAPPRIRTGLLDTMHSHLVGKLRVMLDSPDYEVVSVCEPDPALRARRQNEAIFQGLQWVSEEQLLADSSIQLIVVESDVANAVPLGRKVIAAGKHLHLEKPPAHQMAPFRELVEEARRRRLLVQLGYIWRFHEGIRRAMEAARNGWLGEVYMMRGTINTDVTAEARPALERYRGGMMFELGCHLIDRAVDFWGRPKATRAWLRHDSGVPGTLADNTLAVMEYDAGLAVITCSGRMAGAGPHRSYELIGTDGAFQIQPVEPGTLLRVMMRQARGPYQAGWQEISLPAQPRYVGDFRDLARAIQTGQPLRYSYDYELLLEETLLRVCGELKI